MKRAEVFRSVFLMSWLFCISFIFLQFSEIQNFLKFKFKAFFQIKTDFFNYKKCSKCEQLTDFCSSMRHCRRIGCLPLPLQISCFTFSRLTYVLLWLNSGICAVRYEEQMCSQDLICFSCKTSLHKVYVKLDYQNWALFSTHLTRPSILPSNE